MTKVRMTYEQKRRARTQARADSAWSKAMGARAASLGERLRLAKLGVGAPGDDVHQLAAEYALAREQAAAAGREAHGSRRIVRMIED
jgi:hypothetical protein